MDAFITLSRLVVALALGFAGLAKLGDPQGTRQMPYAPMGWWAAPSRVEPRRSALW